MVQAPSFKCLSFDPFSRVQNGLAAPEGGHGFGNVLPVINRRCPDFLFGLLAISVDDELPRREAIYCPFFSGLLVGDFPLVIFLYFDFRTGSFERLF